MPIKDFYFYILTRQIQPERTFYALGVMAGHGVPREKIVLHFGPECTAYETIEDMHAAFLSEHPEYARVAERFYKEPRVFGCFWGSLACIKRFLESDHRYCYFVQDDFVPVRSSIIEYPIAEIINEFNTLARYDANFNIFVYVYRRLTKDPAPKAQILEDFFIQKGLCGYGDMGLILSKEGAAYMLEKMKEKPEVPEDVIKRAAGTPDGDSFYISLKGLERYSAYRHTFKEVHGLVTKTLERKEIVT